ncbi:WUSCHEL-related homeobox 6 [Zea mays]|uniref:Homeobox domain-containing protein n=2 Tax=Zea mays TaxID=4577 RepID=A0A804LJI4_MAIZE|eukprot:XP_008655176.1 WUSCHEL-related homeobox 6 [Zea mays]
MEGGSNSPDGQSSGGSPEERGSGGSGGRGTGEPARSRWTPKPEQILILESIFNSGMVNPPKDETVRIRKLLERFGAVGDANVFYWFQNRRSRSRRRQRQMQAAAAAAAAAAASSASNNSSPAASATVGLPSGALQYPLAMGGTAACQYEQQASSSSSSGSTGGSSLGLFALGAAGVPGTGGGGYFQASCGASSPLATGLMGDVDSSGGSDDLFAISRQMGFAAASTVASASVAPSSNAHHQQYYSCESPAATITVFINGVPMEVPRGPIDLRAMFGQDVMLVHSTGVILPVNDYGILTQTLQLGESYFLVARPT